MKLKLKSKSFNIIYQDVATALNKLELTKSSVAVLSKLISLDKDGEVITSFIYLAEKLVYSRQTIIRSIKQLCDVNLIVKLTKTIKFNTKYGNIVKRINSYVINYELINKHIDNIKEKEPIKDVKEFDGSIDNMVGDDENMLETIRNDYKNNRYETIENKQMTMEEHIKTDFVIEEENIEPKEEENIKEIDNFLDMFMKRFHNYLQKRYKKAMVVGEIIKTRDILTEMINRQIKDFTLKEIKEIWNSIVKYLNDWENNEFVPNVANVYDFKNKFYNIYGTLKKKDLIEKEEDVKTIEKVESEDKRAFELFKKILPDLMKMDNYIAREVLSRYINNLEIKEQIGEEITDDEKLLINKRLLINSILEKYKGD